LEEEKKKSSFFVNNEGRYPTLRTGRVILVAVLAVFLVFTILGTFTVVPSGYTGVRSVWGIVDTNHTVNGFSWKIPWVQKVEHVNNKIQETGIEGQIWSETKNRTAVFYESISISYSILPEESAWIVANVNDYKNNLITSAVVSSAVKMSSKDLTDEQATSRAVIEPIITQNLDKVLTEKFGKQVVAISRVSVGNADFEDSYNQAIADKQNAQIAYEKQKIENQKAVEKAEADASVKKTEATAKAEADKIAAEANAEVKKINAKANAEAKIVEADAEAEANKKISDSITENILKNEYYKAWDGKLPGVLSSSEGMNLMLPTTNN